MTPDAATLDRALRQGVAYLRRSQQPDGGFGGLASARPDDFGVADRHPTIFMSALISSCLARVDGTATIRRRAAGFLLGHKGPAGSWNYWVRGAAAHGRRRYPDDLDDTACALAALWHDDPARISGELLALFVRQLIAVEAAPGGPYRTWLVAANAPAVWRDIDIAVNANIGYFLSLQNVRLPGLERYIERAIDERFASRRELRSPYYVGELPVLYFVARWYRGPGAERLGEVVAAALASGQYDRQPLSLALLVAAGSQLGLPAGQLAPAAGRLLALRTGAHWPAAALYFEPPVRGVQRYAGSDALTAAFCLEALAAYRRAAAGGVPPAADGSMPPPADSSPAPLATMHWLVVEQALRHADAVAHPDLRRHYRQQLKRLAARDRDHQITGMAATTAIIATMASGRVIDEETLLHLNTASLQGWTAYMIYDDFLDGEGQPVLLGVANLALRHAVASFTKALPANVAFQRLVEEVLETVDAANTWEVAQARAPVRRGVVQVERLPDFGDYSQLAQRSWGHTLAAVGALVAAGCCSDGPEVQALQRFFRHFLIARQLVDDAHDWHDDLAHGRITAVVALLLGDAGTSRKTGAPNSRIRVRLASEMEYWRLRFWEHTIVTVAELVNSHAAAARAALASCAALQATISIDSSPARFEAWVEAVEGSMRQAMAGRNQVHQFLAAYRATDRQ